MNKNLKIRMLLHSIQHDIKSMSRDFDEIDRFIEHTDKDCPARKAYRRIETGHLAILLRINEGMPKYKKPKPQKLTGMGGSEL